MQRKVMSWLGLAGLVALVLAAAARQYGDVSQELGNWINVRQDNYRGVPLYCQKCGRYAIKVALYPRPHSYCAKCKRVQYADQ